VEVQLLERGQALTPAVGYEPFDAQREHTKLRQVNVELEAVGEDLEAAQACQAVGQRSGRVRSFAARRDLERFERRRQRR
jgi:hypothetical protein